MASYESGRAPPPPADPAHAAMVDEAMLSRALQHSRDRLETEKRGRLLMQEECAAVHRLNQEIGNIHRWMEHADRRRAALADRQRAEARSPEAALRYQMSAARMARYEARRASGGTFPPRRNDDEAGPSNRNDGGAGPSSSNGGGHDY